PRSSFRDLRNHRSGGGEVRGIENAVQRPPLSLVVGRLREIEGPNHGAVYDLKDVCLLGRALDCQVHIRDLTVSRRHARITRVDDRYMIEDLGSGNGTVVNEQTG